MDIKSEAFAGYLEDAIKTLCEIKSEHIAIVGLGADGTVMTSYFECSEEMKYLIIGQIQRDIVYDMMLDIKEELEEDGGDE